jgi:group I intron endonuclease
MKTGIIYCAHCLISGKKYIGQTRQAFEERIKLHKRDSKRLNLLFYRAIRKHGWDNFVWGIVEECNENLLNEKEIYWIEKFNSYNEGYNSTLGGGGTSIPSKWKKFELKSPIGEIVRGENISNFCDIQGLSISLISSVLSGKIKSHKGWTLPNTELYGVNIRAKEFVLISPNGEIYKSRNIREFSRIHNLNHRTVSDLLNGKHRSHRGWTLS